MTDSTASTYTAAWTSEGTDTWDLIIGESGFFAGEQDAHMIGEYHTSVPVGDDYPDDDYLYERGWRASADKTHTYNAAYFDVTPLGIIVCRECGRSSAAAEPAEER